MAKKQEIHTHEIGGHTVVVDESSPDEHQAPEWVLEAEQLYLSKKVLTYESLARRFGKSKGAVGQWAVKRQWTARKRKIDAQAAQELKDRIDTKASQEVVNTFDALDNNIIVAGFQASKLIKVHIIAALEGAGKALSNKTKLPAMPKPPQGLIQVMEMAQALRPQATSDNDDMERIGELLNRSPEELEKEILEELSGDSIELDPIEYDSDDE